MERDRTLTQIAQGLTWIGGAFLVASGAVIVWAVFRTVGVDDLLVALTVAGLGLGLPAVVAFVVAWILNSLGSGEADLEDEEEASEPVVPPKPVLANVAWAYVVAVLACIAAWGVRILLDPLLGQQVTYAPLLLSVAFAAWYGGIGPAALATLLGAGISWYAYLSPRDRFGALGVDDAVQLGLYCAAALCIGGIASALRASRERAQTLTREVLAREAGLERARHDLAAERDRMQVTLQSIADAVIATDAQWTVTFVNDCAAALTGWAAAEAVGKPLSRIFRTIDEDSRRNTTLSVEEGQADATAGMLLVARDGTERAIASKVRPLRGRNDAPSGFVLVFHDTTEARRTRAALEESEARFRVLADQMPLPVWMSDESRAYVYVNPAWRAFTGRSEAEELGDGWTACIHPEDFGPRQAAFADAFEARTSFTLEYRLRRHDGQYRWVLDHGAPRFDGDAHFAGYIGAVLDVTDRKEAAATRGLFEQRRTAFLASLAHELRNPLAPIRSSIELLQRMPAGNDPRVPRAQEIIERNCARLAGLVDDLLDLSRLDSGNVQLDVGPVDVEAAVERAAARHAAAMRDRGQQVAIDVEPGAHVHGDAERVEQMLSILIGNASKHTPQGGEIGVTATTDDGDVRIDVRDTGAGIDEALRPILFDLFDNAGIDNSHRLGTGLAIVARLARLSGGSIEAASEGKGRGSTFVLRLPSAAHVAATDERDAPRAAASARKLLVVDDNVDAADAIATLLSLNAYEVETAHNPAEAMERAHAFDPDVILLDIGLPGMTGYELAKKLHADPVARRAKLLAITGYGQPGDTEQAREAGFDGYLVKPVDLEQLDARIEAILADAPRRA